MRSSADEPGVRLLAALPAVLAAALLAAPVAGAGRPAPDWAAAQIATVPARGIFAGTRPRSGRRTH